MTATPMVTRLTPSGPPPAEAAIAPEHGFVSSDPAGQPSVGALDDEVQTTPFVANTFTDPDCVPTTPIARYPRVREPTLLTIRSASDGQDALRAHVAACPVPSSRSGHGDWDEVRRPKVAFNPRLRVTAEAVCDFPAPPSTEEQTSRRSDTLPMGRRQALASAAARIPADEIPAAAPSVAPLVLTTVPRPLLRQGSSAYSNASMSSKWATGIAFIALAGVVCLALVTGWEVLAQSRAREAARDAESSIQGFRVDSAQPGVTMTIDGRDRHALPAKVRLPAGSHQLHFEADDSYESIDRTVVVPVGDWISLSDVVLPVRRAQLNIEIVQPLGAPVGAVVLKQRATGTSKRVQGPFPRVVTIPPSGWDLIVEHEGYEPYVFPLNLAPDEMHKTVWVDLTPSSPSP